MWIDCSIGLLFFFVPSVSFGSVFFLLTDRSTLLPTHLACFDCDLPSTLSRLLAPPARLRRRYVGLCINMTLGIYWGKTVYYLALLWTGSMMSFFVVSVFVLCCDLGVSCHSVCLLVCLPACLFLFCLGGYRGLDSELFLFLRKRHG